jgi:hypothetical protein
MNLQLVKAELNRRLLCIVLIFVMATAPSVSVVAQGFGAVQAVRQRVSGLEGGPEAPPGESPPAPGPSSSEQPISPGAMAGKLDTRYVPSTASALLVIRPAQMITAPIAQMLPVEVASAAGRQYLGIDPVDVDEVVIFGDVSNPIAPAYGAAVKFNKPFRAVALPQNVRPMVQLAEFNGKKYLQSSHPLMPSFYGPDNKTLLLAPDTVLRKMVETSGQPKSGQLLDRVREVPAGSDLYLAVDVASLRGLVPMLMGQAHITMPPEAMQMLESTAALELTLNLVSRGPVSLVIQCNDEAAAQQIEMFLAAAKQNMAAAPPGEQPAGDNPIAQAMTQFRERISQRFQPQRNGASITFLNITAEDPLQPQLFGMVVGAIGASAGTMKSLPAMKMAQPVPGNGPVATSDGGPEVTDPPASPAEGAAPETERR